LPYVIIRPTNNYGIGQYVEKLIPKTVKYLSVGRKVDLHNNGTPVRTWLYAGDTAQAVIKIIESGVVNEIYNISGNYETENINVVKKIVSLMELGDPLEDYIEHMIRVGQDVRYSIDDSKLRRLGWKPEAIFDKELVKIVEYYKENFIW
jgi:dTDP-glucose 4,6-dehydratase